MAERNSRFDPDHNLDLLNRIPVPWVIEKAHKKAAVLVPFFLKNGEWHLLFTRRTDTVHTHKGQVSFPGGQQDVEDVSPEATALREAWEEIGLKETNVKLYGKLKVLQSNSDFSITPIVGRILKPFEYRISRDEVSKVFSIPLSWLVDKNNYSSGEYRSNGRVYSDVITYQLYQGELLWGISARITLDLLSVLEN